MAKQTKKKPVVRSPASSAAGRTNVLLEEMQAQMRVVVEAVTSERGERKRDIQELDTKLTTRIEALEFATRLHSTKIGSLEAKVDQLDGKVDRLDSKVDQLITEVRGISAKLDTKVDVSRVNALEDRVGVLEVDPS